MLSIARRRPVEIKIPEQTVELRDDEAQALLHSSRCQICRHLSAFHHIHDVNIIEQHGTTYTRKAFCNLCGSLCN